MAKKLLLYILSTVVNGRPLDCSKFEVMEAADWKALYKCAKRQGVTAVVWEKLSEAYNDVPDFPKPPKEVTMKWYANSMAIERKMAVIRKRSEDFAALMAESGLQTLVLKGVAMSPYYPNPLHREFGDLDCYLFGGTPEYIEWDGAYERGNVAAEQAGHDVKRGFYKHSHIGYNGLEIENHQFSLPIKDGEATKDLERYLRRVASPRRLAEGSPLFVPSADFNALFLTAHSMSHFLYESIKLRHLLDWALFLKVEQGNVDWTAFWQWCDKMHYSRLAECLNYLCKKYLGLETIPERHAVPNYDVPRMAERILNDIFMGDSLYTKGYGGFRFRVELAKSYYKSLWKFRDVYQRNALWLLLIRVWGMTIKDVKL